MNALRLLVFGSEGDLAAPWVAEWKSRFAAEGASFEVVLRDKTPPPARNAKGGFDVAILIWKSADAAQLKSWGNWFAGLPQRPRMLAVVDGALPTAIKSLFSPEQELKSSAGFDALLALLRPAPIAKQAADGEEEELGEVISLDIPASQLEDPKPVADLSVSSAALSPDELGISMSAAPKAAPAAPSSDLMDALNAFDAAIAAQPAAGGSEGVVALEESNALAPPPAELGQELDLGPADAAPLELAAGTGVADVSKSEWQFSNPEPVAGEGSSPGVSPVGGIWDAGGGAQDAAVADEEAQSRSEDKSISSRSPIAEDSKYSMSYAVGGTEEFQTLQRYAALKEREAREKDAAIQALNRQLDQIRDRLARSEGERRRLAMAMSELDAVKRSLQDERDQAKHHAVKNESAHQEELRAMQLRLDNAQFQASRAEKKLEEFRERVRADIQKIRMRERELSNRLELQKRDAEALLAAKDERLLQQKREIDRLEYENEMLRERLLEQTQKAEDRVARVSRAVKALKMAGGMLSGIEDEVLPSANDKGDGEEAA